ncbi:Camphor resistance CrcB protein [Penicillium cf. griseofulvum]|uniref:Camphor resistance CrcB protein n=1 Tax=Penicillium cf. griseofulvum TaxID=2972120 RepID=A0A9W9JP36_9EURO|nr:Camphor resistance CrcB protein [Penicillium cf. griseofulvum]KAJ5423468.1 Camphor resistance CrcB protein [Penicillium cf. griseofulvum]KAJ5431264.1 Camphor resistance CrcB protein [Penicillium cf. griseofulvum]
MSTTEEGNAYTNYSLTEAARGNPNELWPHSGDHAPAAPAPPASAAQPLSKQATHIYTVSYLIFFSLLGTLARLGLQALTFYTGAPVVTGVLWANVGGSLVMGFLSEDHNLFREEWGETATKEPATGPVENEPNIKKERHKAVKKTIPLYIGLTTGFCGCFTSFSTFMRDVFLALANALPDPSLPTGSHIASRNGGYSFMALVAVVLLNVSLSLSALIFGAHLALALTRVTPTVPFALTRRVLDRVVVVLACGCWLGAVFLAIWPPDRHNGPDVWRGRAVFALVFSPLGCLLRFYVSLHLNSRIPTFPLGTFVVNIFGTIIEGLCYDLQHVSGLGAVVPAALTGCQVLQGVMDGFCGSTTTISTWVSELKGLSHRRYAYMYGSASVLVALGFLVIIMGSLLWTRGFDEAVCG